jgi:transcriptional regulator with XRE-family HTH domain
MDLVLKLRELRARSRLTQEQVGKRANIGVKTISSFESGTRVDSMKVSQLQAILRVYGVTLAQFFSRSIDHHLAPWEVSEDPVDVVARRLENLPPTARAAIAEKISTMIDAVETVLPITRVSSPSTSHATLQ